MLSERVPDLKQPVGELKAGLSELLLGGQPLAVEPEVALQVTPTRLPLLWVKEVVCPPAIARHDPGELGAEPLDQPVAVTVRNDPEDHARSRRAVHIVRFSPARYQPVSSTLTPQRPASGS